MNEDEIKKKLCDEALHSYIMINDISCKCVYVLVFDSRNQIGSKKQNKNGEVKKIQHPTQSKEKIVKKTENRQTKAIFF